MAPLPRPPARRIPPDGWSVDSRRSLLSAGSDLSILSAGCQLSVLSAGCLLSLASSGSILSIGSAGSVLSIGSVGSILSVGSVGSLLSVGSAFSIRGRRGDVRTVGGRDDGADVQPVAPRLLGLGLGALALVAAVTDR